MKSHATLWSHESFVSLLLMWLTFWFSVLYNCPAVLSLEVFRIISVCPLSYNLETGALQFWEIFLHYFFELYFLHSLTPKGWISSNDPLIFSCLYPLIHVYMLCLFNFTFWKISLTLSYRFHVICFCGQALQSVLVLYL